METCCDQCNKNLSIEMFDMKNEIDYYTRCKPCRIIHNQKNKESYTSTKKKFSDYDGITDLGKNKVDCWSTVNELNPCDVAMSCNKKFWFTCDKCPHEFEKSLDKITGRGGWCPHCSNQKLCNKEDCNYCFKKSVADFNGLTPSGNKKLDRWSNKNPPARDISKQSNIKFWFDCDKCPHDFESPMSTIYKRHWCPYCCDSVRKLCKKDCDYCFKNSFASYDGITPSGKKKVNCWSSKNIQQPCEISVQCNKKFWFTCDKCFHEFESSLNKVAGNKPGWCSYCCIPSRKSCKKDCDYCFNKSFANYDGITPSGKKKVDCWSSKNKLKPRDVARRCGIKYWFKCDTCPHEFESSPDSIGSKKSCWCPYCKNKTELKLYNWLLQHNNIKEVKREYAPKWCSTEYTHIVKNKCKKGKYQYRFDFLVTFKNKKQLIIELDGPQHYEQVSDWKAPLEQQIRDKYKEFKAKENKIPLTRCIQEDVLMDRNDWQIKLENKLLPYH